MRPASVSSFLLAKLETIEATSRTWTQSHGSGTETGALFTPPEAVRLGAVKPLATSPTLQLTVPVMSPFA